MTYRTRQEPDRVITADASRVSPLDFFDAITGSSKEQREERDRLMYAQCIAAIQRGDTYGWPPAIVEICRAMMDEGLTTCVGDPLLKRRAA